MTHPDRDPHNLVCATPRGLESDLSKVPAAVMLWLAEVMVPRKRVMTPAENEVLDALSLKTWRSTRGVADRTSLVTGGAYAVLCVLEFDGLVESRREEGKLTRWRRRLPK